MREGKLGRVSAGSDSTSGRAAVLGVLGFLALVVLDSSGSSELLL